MSLTIAFSVFQLKTYTTEQNNTIDILLKYNYKLLLVADESHKKSLTECTNDYIMMLESEENKFLLELEHLKEQNDNSRGIENAQEYFISIVKAKHRVVTDQLDGCKKPQPDKLQRAIDFTQCLLYDRSIVMKGKVIDKKYSNNLDLPYTLQENEKLMENAFFQLNNTKVIHCSTIFNFYDDQLIVRNNYNTLRTKYYRMSYPQLFKKKTIDSSLY